MSILQSLEHFWNFLTGASIFGSLGPIYILLKRSYKIAKKKTEEKKKDKQAALFMEFKKFMELGANQYINENKNLDEEQQQNQEEETI